MIDFFNFYIEKMKVTGRLPGVDLSRTRCAGCGDDMRIARLVCESCDVALEGSFEVAPLAQLSEADQTFVHAFLRHHGSIKKMEAVFGVSYPTVKNRLNAITEQLDRHYSTSPSRQSVLERLARGEIDVDAALEQIAPRNPREAPDRRRR